jgi:hypothetical protein
MDLLIESIHRFAITQNENYFDNCLDEIITRVNGLSTSDADFEWYNLRENFSKVKYLNELLNFYNISENRKLIYLLDLFMETIDHTTRHYLREINWDSQPVIETFLINSLNAGDPLQKLQEITKAYQLLVPIIENLRNETAQIEITDQEFLKNFDLKK